ncbi:MAG: AAA family ATPase, partial [Bacillota bacterium]|nr:AAA family ATPase [Bacillota bacterium]
MYTPSETIISLCVTYGIISEQDGKCKINNKIFELYLYNHMTVKTIRENELIKRYNFRDNFITDKNELDLK